MRTKKKYSSPFGSVSNTGKGSSGGWGNGLPGSKAAGGTSPAVNPFMTPKASGLNVISQTFPSNYYVEWNLSTWRSACDQAIKFGHPVSYATLVSWCFESSPFIQSLFSALGSPIGMIPFQFVDDKGKELPEWTDVLCNKRWHKELRKEIVYSLFWGFSGLNIDPINEKVYKYPMQDIDPVNRMLRQSTYAFYDGTAFSDCDNLLFIQPSTSYERFLGFMQPITRSFIQINQNKGNWISAGRKLAFPLLTVGYPQDDVNSVENAYKTQASDIVANAEPGQALVYPYTIDSAGKIVKSLEIEFEKTGAAAAAHKIYSDFNNDEKNEIREMILGGTLTSSVGASGSRALGDVHEGKLDTIIQDILEYVESVLNDEYLKKISKFYKNFPSGKFIANHSKQMSMDEIKILSAVLNENGKRLTDNFFKSNGLMPDFFEDSPAPSPVAAFSTVKKKFI